MVCPSSGHQIGTSLTFIGFNTGSCQFPTLGFVVDQYRRIQEFQAEDFWKLELSLRKENQKVDFLWARNHLFDQRLCAILYEKCMENPVALISSVISKPTFK